MSRYLVRRLLIMVPSLLLVSLMIFSLVRLLPGDIVVAKAGETGIMGKDAEAIIRRELGLDEPFFKQYVVWVTGIVRGDMGDSLWTGKNTVSEIKRTLPVTIQLAVMALLMALIIGIPFGVLTARFQDTPFDYFGRFFSTFFLSVPGFLKAILVLLYLSIWFRWTPPFVYHSLLSDPKANLIQYALPSLLLGLALCASGMRMTRSSMLEVLRQDYIRTAQSKGLSDRVILFRHSLKNAAIPVVTIIGLQFSGLLGGTVIIETIFGLPGMGSLTLDALAHRDFTQVQASIMFMSLVVMGMNLLVDISYGWLDPRIRYS